MVRLGSDVAGSTAHPDIDHDLTTTLRRGGEEVERLTSSDPHLLAWIGDRVSSED